MNGEKDFTFVVRCVGYKQESERYFTVGKEYEVHDGRITADNGYEYRKDDRMTPDSDPETWWLSGWYQFKMVDVFRRPEHLDITIDDLLG
jgi:hypothetical protein